MTPPLPLQGVTVLDLTRLLPGAICTLFLVDMGATVIKIEDPTAGDYARWTPPLIDGLGAFFRASNRNKQSVVLDLKRAEGQAVLHRLVTAADVVVEGFRPHVTARLGADYATLSAINPRLVYASLSGWGQTGDYADMSGHDLNYVALGGLLGAMRTPQPLGGQVADVGGAYAGALGIAAGLFARERTGSGTYLDIALFEAALPFAMYEWVERVVAGADSPKSLTGGMPFYDVYTSADGQPLAFAPIEPKFWANFCAAVARPDWVARHADPTIRAELTALFASKTAAEWDALLTPAECCFSLVTPPERLSDNPHVRTRDVAGVGADGVPYLRSPVRFGASQLGQAPQWGEHTRSVLAQHYTAEELDALFASGVVGRGGA